MSEQGQIIPDRLAMMDQLGADLRGWAKVYGEFRAALIEVGYADHEALEVVLQWQDGMLSFQRQMFAMEHGYELDLDLDPREDE